VRDEKFREVEERMDVSVECFDPLVIGNICDVLLHHLERSVVDLRLVVRTYMTFHSALLTKIFTSPSFCRASSATILQFSNCRRSVLIK